MKHLMLMILCATLMIVTTSCSTVKGLGNDIQTVGHWFVKGSDKVENAQK